MVGFGKCLSLITTSLLYKNKREWKCLSVGWASSCWLSIRSLSQLAESCWQGNYSQLKEALNDFFHCNTAFWSPNMRPANWDCVTWNQCLLIKKLVALYILEPQAAKRTLLDSSARYCCHTHLSVELLTRLLSTFSLLSWQCTHVHTRHTLGRNF